MNKYIIAYGNGDITEFDFASDKLAKIFAKKWWKKEMGKVEIYKRIEGGEIHFTSATESIRKVKGKEYRTLGMWKDLKHPRFYATA